MKKLSVLFVWILLWGCGSDSSSENNTPTLPEATVTEVVLFAMNDMHGKIDRFSKVKPFIDKAKANSDKVFMVSGGDLFSGNPIVDFHPEKGSPIVNLMGAVGMDISVLGNHEFDYGQAILNDRITQATFPFICANVSNTGGELLLPEPYVVIEKGGFKIAFVGVVENSSKGGLPLSHPKNMEGLSFKDGAQVISTMSNVPEIAQADLVIAVTHYGKEQDRLLIDKAFVGNESFIDLVVGGHNHMLYNEKHRGIPMIQTGAHMQHMAKLVLSVSEGKVIDYTYELIDLSEPHPEDPEIATQIVNYNNRPEFYTALATASHNHDREETGCFYTTALKETTQAALVVQNYGGIRANINQGTIRPYDVYTIDPFGNGLETYSVTVSDLKSFFTNNFRMAYSGLYVGQENGQIVIKQSSTGAVLQDTTHIKIAVNDYISNLNPEVFNTLVKRYELTTADYLIAYLKDQESPVNNQDCDRSID